MTPSDPISALDCRVYVVCLGEKLSPDEIAVQAGIGRSDARDVCDRLFERGILARFGAYPDLRFRSNTAPMQTQHKAHFTELRTAILGAVV